MLIIVLFLCVITGCAQVVDQPEPAAPHVQGNFDQPTYSGPYSDLLTEIWRETPSDYVRSVIADGLVSDEEWAEVGNRIEQCLAQHSIVFQGFQSDGSYRTKANNRSFEELEPIMVDCEKSSGERWIGMLRNALIQNPQNIPREIIVRECMVRLGVVDASYSAESFLRDYPAATFPFDEAGPGLPGFYACDQNPNITEFTS